MAREMPRSEDNINGPSGQARTNAMKTNWAISPDSNIEVTMKKVKINRRLNLVLYDGINEMPMGNFREFNRFVMLDAGLGSDIQDIDNKFAAVIKFIMQGKKEEGAKELINTRQAIALVLNGTNLKQMSFVPFIHTLNGERVTDLSEEGAREVLRRMEQAMVTQGWVIEMLGGLKKKLTPNSMFSFLRTRKRRADKTSTTSTSRGEQS